MNQLRTSAISEGELTINIYDFLYSLPARITNFDGFTSG